MRTGRYLVRTAPGPRTAQAHLKAARFAGRAQAVHQPQVAAALVDDALPVGGRVPGVEVGVVGVPPQVRAVRLAGVDVGDALVVGEERDPVTHEHHRVQVPAQVRQQPGAVQPHPAHRAAAVALPGGGLVRRLAGQQQRAALDRVVVVAVGAAVGDVPVRMAVALQPVPVGGEVGDRDVRDRAPGQPPAGAAVRRDAVGPGVVREGLAVRGDRQDLAVRGPAADAGVGAPPIGEAAGRAALHRGEVDLGVETAPGGEGEVSAVRGEPRVADPGAVDRQPPGPGASPPSVVSGATQRSSSAAKHSISPWRCGNRRYAPSLTHPWFRRGWDEATRPGPVFP